VYGIAKKFNSNFFLSWKEVEVDFHQTLARRLSILVVGGVAVV
jgi:hypothetical protein